MHAIYNSTGKSPRTNKIKLSGRHQNAVNIDLSAFGINLTHEDNIEVRQQSPIRLSHAKLITSVQKHRVKHMGDETYSNSELRKKLRSPCNDSDRKYFNITPLEINANTFSSNSNTQIANSAIKSPAKLQHQLTNFSIYTLNNCHESLKESQLKEIGMHYIP